MAGTTAPDRHVIVLASIITVSVGAVLLITALTVMLYRRRSSKKRHPRRNISENSKIFLPEAHKRWYSKERMRPVPGQVPVAITPMTSSEFTIPTYNKTNDRRNSFAPPNRQSSDATIDTNASFAESANAATKEEEAESNSSSGGGGLTKWHSEEHLPSLCSVLEAGRNRSGSCLTIGGDNDSLETESASFRLLPSIDLSLVWASSSATLSITISKLSNIPPKLSKSQIVATMRLTPPQSFQDQDSPPTSPVKATLPISPLVYAHRRASCALTKDSKFSSSNLSLNTVGTGSSSSASGQFKVKKTLDDNFSQVFTFHDLSFADVQDSAICLDLKTRKGGGLMGTRPFGEATYSLSESELEPDAPLNVTLDLCPARKGSQIFPPGSLLRSSSKASGLYSGSLQILLMYQITGINSSRVKLVILRGKSLVSPRSGGDYRVDVVVRVDGEVVESRKSSNQPLTPAPVWNYSMLFDVQQAKAREVTLEATLIRVGRTRRTTKLGQVFIGLQTTDTGRQHWQQALDRPDREFTMWHPIIT